MISEEEFYEEKIFNKVQISQLRRKFPNQTKLINDWYRSERFKSIQSFKSFLTNKLKQVDKAKERINITNELLYRIYQRLGTHPKKCYYCSLPESELESIEKISVYKNKRYPQRGKSLEIERKIPDLPYTNIENLELVCYWCNNAKTDTFTESEFLKLGSLIKNIWENRLAKKL